MLLAKKIGPRPDPGRVAIGNGRDQDEFSGRAMTIAAAPALRPPVRASSELPAAAGLDAMVTKFTAERNSG